MTSLEFKKVLEYRIHRIREVLDRKSGEYARNGDRLSNFKRAAGYLQCTPEYANLGANSKHLTSIADMVDDLDRGVSSSMELWEEKIGDAINYLILLEALVHERLESDSHTKPKESLIVSGMEGL